MADEGKKAKKTIIPDRVHMAEQAAEERVNNFKEVPLGYTEDQAAEEAKRCLQCKKALCSTGCPVEINIPEFINLVAEKKFGEAAKKIKATNSLPAVCGRVCPAEYQCRKACVLTKKASAFASDEAINIHFLERFAGDYGIENLANAKPALSSPKKLKDVKVAVVGSGPAGLCAAGELARCGIKVSLFESLHRPGGVLRYGIPPFRLGRKILDFEIV